MPHTPITTAEYRALAAVRFRIRRFLIFSESAARAAGMEPQHHQLLLAVRGLPPGTPATVKAIADRLQIKHNSAVELIARAEDARLVVRHIDPEDRRRVAVRLTRRGATTLERLSRKHRRELASAGADLVTALRTLMRTH